MTAKELRDYILTKMTAEEALLRLLQSHVEHYEKLKVQMDDKHADDEGHNQGSPIMIIAAAAMDLGWQIAVENTEPDAPVRGLTVGTGAYLDAVLK
jgi:hypothetical protein